MKKFFLTSILIHLVLFVSASFFLTPNKVAKKSYELSYVSVKELSPTTNKKSENNIKPKTSELVSKKAVRVKQQKQKTVFKDKAVKSTFTNNSFETGKQKVFDKSGFDFNKNSSPKVLSKIGRNAKVNQKSFTLPSYKFSPKPEYPIIAKKRGYEGEIMIDVYVLKNGSVGKLKLLKTSGFKVLDESAVKAVEKWEFIPAKNKGVAVSTWVKVPISFKLISG